MAMRIKNLHLENIGPFTEADLELFGPEKAKPPVVLITGENGTGKSILLDAIRGLFGPLYYSKLERDIRRRGTEDRVSVRGTFGTYEQEVTVSTTKSNEQVFEVKQNPTPGVYQISVLPHSVQQGADCPYWVVDFWSSNATTGSYQVNELRAPNHKSVFVNSLQGTRVKSDITQLICHFDYLRSSEDSQEKNVGEILYKLLGRIISASLLEGGHFSHVARTTYEPIIVQNGIAIGLANLSSGNAYLIHSLVGLLGKMYSIHVLRNQLDSTLPETPGLLLIDEAENQLHPKWQKRLIHTILDLFPNLQIIATTHSPFIISSVENARLFVCKSQGDHCIVVDETAEYSNKPVDEILLSPLFEETQPFNEEITSLLEQRKQAIANGDERERGKIERQLQAINPTYFAYFDIDRLLAEVANGKVRA
jgi:predicted ATP-binding protein involved in virulence